VSDLRRWRDEGASGEELRLLEDARGERPDPALRARTLEALGISGPAPDGGGSGAGPAPAPGRLLSLVKLAGVVLAVGGAVTAGVLAMRGQPRPPAGGEAVVAVAPASPGGGARAAREAEPLPGASAPTPTPTAAPALDGAPMPARASSRPRVRTAATTAAPPHAPPSRAVATLADEVRLLEHAQRALAAGDPVGALKVCDRYRAAFTAGKLAPEETILRVRALLATGARQRAVSLAHAFVSAHPDSPYAARIRAIIE
jgi:hypothetical protein